MKDKLIFFNISFAWLGHPPHHPLTSPHPQHSPSVETKTKIQQKMKIDLTFCTLRGVSVELYLVINNLLPSDRGVASSFCMWG